MVYFQLLRQGIDHGHAHTVQAAAELVVLVGKLAAGVQRRQDHLDAGLDSLLRVHVHGHAAAVVGTDKEPSACSTTSICLAWPASASSTLLSMTSWARWLGRVVSVYMPGRLRTGSSPVRTSMDSDEYSLS
jgi:hypothetical protein